MGIQGVCVSIAVFLVAALGPSFILRQRRQIAAEAPEPRTLTSELENAD